jgi:ubiquinone/menaquinone biosynthesis C-methylase UbiE
VDHTDRERREIEYWRNSPEINPDSHSLDALKNTVNKLGDAGVFIVSIEPSLEIFRAASHIVELGAGQGWASAMVKQLCPQAMVTAVDISEEALAMARVWSPVFRAAADKFLANPSYRLSLESSSVDVIFAFASAHHFGAQRRTLAEIYRVLKPGGHGFYFHEPSCQRFWYRPAVWRVNRKRPSVPEDVLVYKQIQRLAEGAGLHCQVHFRPVTFNRGPMETLYYSVLNAVPVLCRLLPCTVTYQFRKLG